MELISQTSFVFLVVFTGWSILSFWIGRAYERKLWMPGKGLHLIGVGEQERFWIVRHDSKVPDLGSREVKGWNELSGKQRDRAIRRQGPPKSIQQAREFLYEVNQDGLVTGSVGPTEENGERYSLSFERQGGYTP